MKSELHSKINNALRCFARLFLPFFFLFFSPLPKSRRNFYFQRNDKIVDLKKKKIKIKILEKEAYPKELFISLFFFFFLFQSENTGKNTRKVDRFFERLKRCYQLFAVIDRESQPRIFFGHAVISYTFDIIVGK